MNIENQKNFIKKIGTKFCFTCLYCNEKFISPGYEVRAGRKIKYCSNKCQAICPKRRNNAKIGTNKIKKIGKSNPNFRHGKRAYSYARKNVCEICGLKEKDIALKNIKKLSVHHKDMDKTNFSIENLATLCNQCHGRVHAKKYYGKYPEFQKW